MAKRPKLDKKDVKGPDQFQAQSAKIWKWAEENLVALVGTTLVVFLGGLGFVLYGQYQSMQMAELQSVYYEVEKPFMEKREDYLRADSFMKSLEGQKEEDRKKALEDAEKNKIPTKVSSGDLQKDYGDTLTGLQNFIDQHAKSQSAILAALNLADVYMEYEKSQEGLTWVEKVAQSHQPNTMPSVLLWTQLGNLQADLGRCPDAINSWQKVISGSQQKFIEKDLRLRTALCYKTDNPEKAKEMLKALSLDFPDSSAGKLAKKYLRGMTL